MTTNNRSHNSTAQVVGALLFLIGVVDLTLLALAGTLSSPCVPGTSDSMDFWPEAVVVSVGVMILGAAVFGAARKRRSLLPKVRLGLTVLLAVVLVPVGALLALMAAGAYSDRSSPPGVCDTGTPTVVEPGV